MAEPETKVDIGEVFSDEIMRKKSESENSKSNHHDEDSESAEEQPLDAGVHYLVRRTDNSWCKFLVYSNLKIIFIIKLTPNFPLFYYRPG